MQVMEVFESHILPLLLAFNVDVMIFSLRILDFAPVHLNSLKGLLFIYSPCNLA